MVSKQTIVGMPDNFPIEDAEEELQIIVTEVDIRLGKQRNPSQCAFARAERRVKKDVVRVEALKTTLYIIYKDHAVRYRLTTQAQKAIKEFDDEGGKKMIPGIYTLKPITLEYAGSHRSTRARGPNRNRGNNKETGHGWIRGKGPKK